MIGTIAFDVILRRPGCVLIQAAMGAAVPDFELTFPADTWLLAPTPNMRLYPVESPEFLVMLGEIAREAIKPRP